MKAFYATLCIVGTLFPYGAFAPWLFEHGLDIGLLLSEAMHAPVAAFAWLDVVVSAVVLAGFLFAESARIGMRRPWLPLAATGAVGVSLGLPLFLLLREIHLEKSNDTH